MTFFANFAQPFKFGGFLREFVRKNQIFTAGQVSKQNYFQKFNLDILYSVRQKIKIIN